MKRRYGVKVAWLKQKPRPTRTDEWVWDDSSYRESILNETLSAVLNFVRDVYSQYPATDPDVHTSYVIGDSWKTNMQSDIVVYVIAKVTNRKNGANWMLIEASELMALINSIK